MADTRDCGEIRPLLAELAVGASTGHERAQALRHVAGCETCQRELGGLSKVADELFLLAPEREPPPGFESRVITRIGEAQFAGTPSRARRRFRLVTGSGVGRPAQALVGAAAAVLAMTIGAGAVWWGTTDDRRVAAQHQQTLDVADGRYLRAVKMTLPDGVRAGTVFLYQGSPSWLLVSVTAAPRDGGYEMVVINRDGAIHPMGICTIDRGTGTAGYHLYQQVSEIAAVQLNGPDGVRLVAQN